MTLSFKQYLFVFALPALLASCVKEIDLSEGSVFPDSPGYLYPYQSEIRNATAEIIIQTNSDINPTALDAEVPKLKYNKSWLFMLTQDDCKQAAFSCTWAAINGKPLSNKYFYDAGQLRHGDLPPDVYSLDKTLGSTDGAGNESRFTFTTTLAPDAQWMNAKTNIIVGYKKNYSRFTMKSGLTWNNVRHMLNYGCGIAFHDVNVVDAENEGLILQQFPIAQDSILKHLGGRGCKFLAEPNGNKTYVNAAKKYAPIQTLTAQAGAVKLYPLAVEDDLHQVLTERWFNDVPSTFQSTIQKELTKPLKERMAIHLGVHATDRSWVQFLLWINNMYGKDGDDSVWFTSQEEYYEYNHYRIHGGTPKVERIDNRTLKLTVSKRPISTFVI